MSLFCRLFQGLYQLLYQFYICIINDLGVTMTVYRGKMNNCLTIINKFSQLVIFFTISVLKRDRDNFIFFKIKKVIQMFPYKACLPGYPNLYHLCLRFDLSDLTNLLLNRIKF